MTPNENLWHRRGHQFLDERHYYVQKIFWMLSFIRLKFQYQAISDCQWAWIGTNMNYQSGLMSAAQYLSIVS